MHPAGVPRFGHAACVRAADDQVRKRPPKQQLKGSDSRLPLPDFRIFVFRGVESIEDGFRRRGDPGLQIFAQRFQPRNGALRRLRANPAGVNLLQCGGGGMADRRLFVRQRENQ